MIYIFSNVTVNSENFLRLLFLRNFTCAKFHENKSSPNGDTTLLFTDLGKSSPSHEFLMSQICLLTIFAKIFGFTVCYHGHNNVA